MQIAFGFNDRDNMSGMNSYITGRSTGNQRIERLWVNLRMRFTVFWRNYFKDMIDSGLLRIDGPVHLECLGFCFIPLIQRDLNSFNHLWNSHRIRQQRNVEAPNGIPIVSYYQPEAYGTRLLCELETIDRIQERYFVKKPHFGCKDDFIPVLEHLCEMRREHLSIPESIERATSLFLALTEILDGS
ncbi:hypothetical protein DPMN_010625 [Dreissena polymorpha]|uniref:Integrase core domain-containing protein n=2 Tax=Dreissena polymorpha TaxID=45954 RepID=A0A9D4N3J2_DREPO|nr:hypothetical protein DPMN_080756 [Dreissena polymorpha]KAH3886614.1 hypothetical protein DPMN_010625 [Dreissena polymorpha]